LALTAFFSSGVCDAGAADPKTIDWLIDTNYPVAAGAGWQHDPSHAGSVESFDEPWDHPQRCKVSFTGEQRGISFNSPRQFLSVGVLAAG
jgi:hypothetical protein